MENFEKVEIYYIDTTKNLYFELPSDRECYYAQLEEPIIGLYGDIKISSGAIFEVSKEVYMESSFFGYASYIYFDAMQKLRSSLKKTKFRFHSKPLSKEDLECSLEEYEARHPGVHFNYEFLNSLKEKCNDQSIGTQRKGEIPFFEALPILT